MKKIAILGSTGSIGTQTLEIVRANKDIEVLGLAAGSNISLLEEQIREFHPKKAAVWNEEKAKELQVKVSDLSVEILTGMEGLIEIAQMEETEIGTPQGGNISPLLANILLNELDWELESRGLRFVRYADDCIILVRSEKAATRVMKSVTKYIENVLRLKVNKDKSRIGRPTEIQYLGFAFYYQFQEKKYRMKVPKKSLDKVMKKVRKLTSRKWSVSNSYKAKKIAEVVRGWINYFKIGSILTVTRKLDTVIRYRFRMCIWKHWKNPKTRYKNLVKLGISKKNARCAAGFHGYARVCRTKTVCYAMSNARLKKFGLLSAEEYLCKARCQVN